MALAVAFTMPDAAAAQTDTPMPQASRQDGATVQSIGDAEDAAMRSLEKTPAVPAAGGRNNRILSQNENYNLGRATEGRVGLRLGNDMSFRVEKRAGTP